VSVRQAGHTAGMDETLNEYSGRNRSGDLDIDGRIKLYLFSKNWSARAWTEFIWPRIGSKLGLLLSR
jgi:hypothetical protein